MTGAGPGGELTPTEEFDKAYPNVAAMLAGQVRRERASHVPTVDEVESIGWIPLAHLVDTHLPEPWPRMGCWRETARFLWLTDYRYMADLTAAMHRRGWIGNPVPVHGGYTQDGTHRVVAALGLGWWARPIPVVAIVKPGG